MTPSMVASVPSHGNEHMASEIMAVGPIQIDDLNLDEEEEVEMARAAMQQQQEEQQQRVEGGEEEEEGEEVNEVTTD